MVGRWFGNMAHGQFVQVAMSEAVPVKGELAIGWIAHYAIGWGKVWLERPTLLPPMILAWVLLVAPYLMMMPGMGMGIAGSRTPKPKVTAALHSKVLCLRTAYGAFRHSRKACCRWPASTSTSWSRRTRELHDVARPSRRIIGIRTMERSPQSWCRRSVLASVALGSDGPR
jgi:hypothetical protein